MRATFEKKIRFFYFILFYLIFCLFVCLFLGVPPTQASADPGLCTQDLKKIDFFFKVANADPVRYRRRLQSCSHRPCALTHRVYEGNFASSFFRFFLFLIFFAACTGQRRPCALTHRVYGGNFESFFSFFFIFFHFFV